MARSFHGIGGGSVLETRVSRRQAVELAVGVRLGEGRGPVAGMMTDLSTAGARVILPAPVEEGRLLELRCIAFTGTARVVWCREMESRVHAGVRFVSIAEGRDALNALAGRNPELRDVRMAGG
ncbi:MAG: PilZ domain-containing protein [Gemmatimonadota bacterium]|jgi:hypothetical protein|nr:PilZ domain-containing protein [Gemmatimonadota bacterium]